MYLLVWSVVILGSPSYGAPTSLFSKIVLLAVLNATEVLSLERPNRRQYQADEGGFTMPTTIEDQKNKEMQGVATRFTTRSTTIKKFKRTTPKRVSFLEDCDYLAQYCLKAYNTGQLCARTLYFTYKDFKNYCMMDYVNCMERYEVWQVVHMGACFRVDPLTEYIVYPYDDDYFLDQYYLLEDN